MLKNSMLSQCRTVVLGEIAGAFGGPETTVFLSLTIGGDALEIGQDFRILF